MNIIVDGRPFMTSNAGISGFLRGSLSAWAQSCSKDSFIVAIPHDIDKTVENYRFPDNVVFIKYSNFILSHLPNLVWLNTYFPYLAKKLKADIYFSALPCIPYLLPRHIKKVIVVHDVVNIEYANTMEWTNKLSNLLFFNRSIKKADYIWANSEYTRAKVNKYFPERKCNDIFVGCAINNNIYKKQCLSDIEIDDIRKKYNINGDFILFVGSLEPRKNLGFLLSIMPKIYRDKQVQLVVVGGKHWKNSSLRDIVESPNYPRECVVFCNYVPDNDLAKLYSIASCFVSTSLNEGFGMPQLEALNCGCPIITSHNSAMIEVAKGKTGAYTVKGYDTETWIKTIEDVLDNPTSPVPDQLADYDWLKILKRFISIFNKNN